MAENVPKIYRIILPVSDLAKALEFYSSLLGVEGRHVGGGRVYFDCGAVILAFLESEKPPNAEYIYFAVPDLEAVYARASALDCLAAIEIHGAPAGEIVVRPWRERSFYAFDPFGNGLCFVDENTLFTGR
jgi:catechol 2,3-dioxygenase-like lactoylglutathione lyase family enzyme